MSRIEVSLPTYDEWEDQSADIVLEHTPNRGDIIHIEEAGSYRNEGMYIWNGEKVVPLYYEIDDYGSVPPTFTIGDGFLVDHWHNILPRNTFVWVDINRYKDQLINNLTHSGTYYDTDMGRFYIDIHSHSPTMGMNDLMDVINGCTSTLSLKYNYDSPDPHRMIYEYTIEDELHKIFGESVSLVCDSVHHIYVGDEVIKYGVDDNDLYYRI